MSYRDLIVTATGDDDAARAAVVEELMRQETGGTLDALDPAAFAALAVQAYGDLCAWPSLYGDDVPLADWCESFGLAVPTLPDPTARG